LQLPFHLCAHTAVQCHTCALEMSSGWDDMYDGLSFLVRHGFL
jgi:hypothetical protein